MLDIVVPIVLFVVILGAVIFVHELGHFFFARRAGIFVEEFALGMGPKLFSFHGKKRSLLPKSRAPGPPPDDEEDSESGAGEECGEQKPEIGDLTLYSLRALPIGGFCRMRGQDEDVPDDPEAMNNKGVFARIMVIAGGSLMNFAAAFLLFFALTMLRGFPIAEVVSLNEEMPGYRAGLQVGDRITHINGASVRLYEDFVFMVGSAGGQEMEVRVARGAESVELRIAPAQSEDGRRLIGFSPNWRLGFLDEMPDEPDGFSSRVGLGEGLAVSADLVLFNIRAPFRLLAGLFGGRPMPEGGGVMGPIGIGGVVAEVYQDSVEFGFWHTFLQMLMFAALLNAMLGVMNLLPVPALDGARLVFLFIEAVRRKPVAPEREAMVHVAGLVALLVFAVFVAYRDIARFL